jgi:hypothetical protein
MMEEEETIAIMIKMAKEEVEGEVEEEAVDVVEETTEVSREVKEVKDKKALKVEDNIEVEEEAEDIVKIEAVIEVIEEIEMIVINKMTIEGDKGEFTKTNKLEDFLKTKSKLKSNKSKINKVKFFIISGQYSKKEA